MPSDRTLIPLVPADALLDRFGILFALEQGLPGIGVLGVGEVAMGDVRLDGVGLLVRSDSALGFACPCGPVFYCCFSR